MERLLHNVVEFGIGIVSTECFENHGDDGAGFVAKFNPNYAVREAIPLLKFVAKLLRHQCFSDALRAANLHYTVRIKKAMHRVQLTIPLKALVIG